MDLVLLITILYLRAWERERGRKLGRERSRLPTRSRIWDLIPDSRITPWVKGRGSTPEPPRHPRYCFLSHSDTLYVLIEAFSLSAFRVIIQRYELCAFVLPEELVFLVTFSGPFSSLLLLVSFFPPLEESILKLRTGLVNWSWTPLYVACLGKSLSLLLSWMTPLLKK